MTDTDILDFVEKHGIQIWPQRKSRTGPVLNWYAQYPFPFVQVARASCRAALADLIETHRKFPVDTSPTEAVSRKESIS